MCSKKITCIVVEDEQQILDSVCETLKSFDEIEIVGTAVGVDSAYQLICKERPDAAFLDVLIQGGSIFDVMDRLRNAHAKIPISIILSGKPEYALHAFKYRNCFFDFFTKAEMSNSKTKFREAIDKVIYEKSRRKNAEKPQDYFFVSTRKGYTKIECEEVFYIETGAKAAGNINIFCRDKIIPLGITLSKFLKNYPLPNFEQIARQRAINISKIKNVNPTDSVAIVNINGERIELGIGGAYMQKLLSKLTV